MTCVIESIGGVHALLVHDIAPVGAEVLEERPDDLIGIAKVVLVELFDVLFLKAINDALDTNVCDCLSKFDTIL